MPDISTAFNEIREQHADEGVPATREILHSLKERVGVEHFCYLRMGDRDPDDVGAVLTTYPDEWHDRYVRQNYQLIDPVVQKGLKSFLPMDWALAKKDDPLVRQFFGEAAEFGVCPSGLTIPVRDPHGRRALFSLNSGMKQPEFEGFTREFMSDLQYLGHLVHDHVCREGGLDFPLKLLTNREVEVMKWAALGKTSWETARICNLAPNTVKFYVRNATAKLEASNKAHAVAKAVKMGIISI
ncbi:helix-turn-helix transcriptional regulator [Salipiger mucosus]|uniref:Autoinducer-binding protein transcriptional regulator LuxR n=1 Tax=Salipiger mucosus DSM 16094 TaxID=1123237 RepID=S9RF81_9RHOB|nr:LuxR family transcriptional regulator [Salipiger mucosus]EPX76770.1 autoinducer-binding protein transcriptional regulator LuxR [Salipiger mucosus DSM 16094]